MSSTARINVQTAVRPDFHISSEASYEAALKVIMELELLGVESGRLEVAARDVRFPTLGGWLPHDVWRSMIRSATLGATVATVVVLMCSIFQWLDPLASFAHVMIGALGAGVLIGAGFGFLWRFADVSLNPTRHVQDLMVARYDVISEDVITATRARRLLG